MKPIDESFAKIAAEQQEAAQRAAREATVRALERARQDYDRRRPGTDGPRWFIGQAIHGDARAQKWLKAEGIEFYYPQVRLMRPAPRMKLSHKQRQGAAPLVPVLRPLWYGYFFLRLDLQVGGWRDAFDRAGIRGVLSPGLDKWRVPKRLDALGVAQLERMRQQEVEGAVPADMTPRQLLFRAGDRVEITDPTSVWFGHGGVVRDDLWDTSFDGLDESTWISLLVFLFGREVALVVPANAVARRDAKMAP